MEPIGEAQSCKQSDQLDETSYAFAEPRALECWCSLLSLMPAIFDNKLLHVCFWIPVKIRIVIKCNNDT